LLYYYIKGEKTIFQVYTVAAEPAASEGKYLKVDMLPGPPK
jgi:hypothetical protein